MSLPVSVKTFLTNFFGGAGYFFAGLGWFWIVVAWIPSLISSHSIDWVLPSGKKQAQPTTPVGDITIPPMIGLIIGFVVTVIILGVTVYILYKLPAEAIKKTSHVAHTASDRVVPVVTHHRKLPETERVRLSARFLFYIKLVATILPLIFGLILVGGQFKTELPASIIVFVSGALTALATICFGLQLGLARAFGTATDKLL